TDIDFEIGRHDSMKVTFAYLGGGLTEESYEATPEWVENARSHLVELGSGITSGAYEPSPSSRCEGCDFLRFCEAGRSFLAETS
ncbi:MAG: PD-(D/E)XK nuclease family protein, partial [Acidimicrobiia bacterium]|nr:PD-(D/E)XK nuclease family protein [Acidimicrobiia bacterium]